MILSAQLIQPLHSDFRVYLVRAFRDKLEISGFLHESVRSVPLGLLILCCCDNLSEPPHQRLKSPPSVFFKLREFDEPTYKV